MTNGNPFYVHPGGDFGPGLQGLAGTLSQIGEQKKAEEEKERLREVRAQAVDAFQSGDPDKIASFAIKNPEAAQAIMAATKFKNESTKQNYIDSIFQAVKNPERIPELVAKRQAFLKTQGLTAEESAETDSFLDKYEQDPAGALKSLEQDLAFFAPERYKQYKAAIGGAEKPTANIQDFRHYQTLLKENPAQADLFAQQVGIKAKPDDRTIAIKEFEYAEKNPKFRIEQKKKEDAKATKETAGKVFSEATGLRKEFLDQSKDYQKVRDSYTRVVGSTQDPSPAGDLSLIFNYMKMLDPGSVVRESEFATAAATGSYGQRIQAGVQKVLSGERLAPEMRADFIKKASVLLNGMQEQHAKRAKSYRKIAERNKLPVEDVVVDITAPRPEENKKPLIEMTEEELRAAAVGGQ